MREKTIVAIVVAVLIVVVAGGSIAIAVVVSRGEPKQQLPVTAQAYNPPDPGILRARQVALLADLLMSREGAALKEVWVDVSAANVTQGDINPQVVHEMHMLGRAMGEKDLRAVLAPFFPFKEGKQSECCRDTMGLDLYWKSCKPCAQAALKCSAYDQVRCKEDASVAQRCQWDSPSSTCKNRDRAPGVAKKVACQVSDEWFRYCSDTPFVNDVGSWAETRASRDTQLVALLRREPKTPADMAQLTQLGFGVADLERSALLREMQRQGVPVTSTEDVKRLFQDVLATNDTSLSADGYCCEDTLKLGVGWKDCSPCERVKAPCTTVRDAGVCKANSDKCNWNGNTQSCEFKVACGTSTSKDACNGRAYCAWSEAGGGACKNENIAAGRQVPCARMPQPWFRACKWPNDVWPWT
ncbi:hypothetical protein HXX76_014082 [Chlamydomonas incerta]|uniref:Uncharacterized protein n=1 Tax=Chlamydomonas incerta TaxID=51695 RepID=A0A835VT58_CHLIN|nr:hypothetical protein HXX76_014076 [Chlamydomonas incerta]KAG2424924.1 hypothetical protein HXX76_014082 [Chlamydomonas incerta]|eukprot:KAG2424918.1 hypothetical protein HXX76_014076 [Chlamydomonas incerta]